MQITSDFQQRVEVLAGCHSKDWRIARPSFSQQDIWLISQQHVRRMGSRRDLVSAQHFVDRVRTAANSIHNRRPHCCLGSLADWDHAWLQMLAEGTHLKDPLSWYERNNDRRCSAVYFVQAKESRFDMARLIYNLQRGLLNVACDFLPRGMLFMPFNGRDEDLCREVLHTNYQFPLIFVVDADELQRRHKLHEVLNFFHERGISWWCDADFISYCLRDATNLRVPYVPLNRNWANHAGWEWRDISYNLVCDMLAT